MKPAARKGFELPDGLEIGERFMLHFDAPDLVQRPQLGRLQDLSNDGALCIEVPAHLSPPRGTPVTISSLRKSTLDYRFSSEILGRRRLNGRLPVLLVKAPDHLEKQQRRTSYRISAALKARVQWLAPGQTEQIVDKPAVITNLSGGGAQIYVRQLPDVSTLRLILVPPEPFVEEWAMRKIGRLGSRPLRPDLFNDPLQQACSQIHALFDRIEGKIIRSSQHAEDGRGPIHALSVAFSQPHDACYRLVRFLERQAAQKGLKPMAQLVANAA